MDKFEKFAFKPHLEGPKQQHYVPRFYLEGFTSEQTLSVFDRVKGEIRHRQKPENLATVGHLYTFEDNQDRKRFDFEVLFGLVEAAATPILKSLVQGESLSPKDRESFALFLGLAAVRTPAAIADAKAAHAGLVKAQTLHWYSDENEVLELLKKKLVPRRTRLHCAIKPGRSRRWFEAIRMTSKWTRSLHSTGR